MATNTKRGENMKNLNEIETMKIGNCIIHICDNAIGTKEEQNKSWQEFCKIACELCNTKRKE